KELQEGYDLASLVINPIPYGTGLKIKTIEALGYAKPLVTTSVGAEGLEEGIDRAFLVADTPEAFAQAIITILDDPEVAARLSRQAYNFARQWNENNLRQLANILLPQQRTENQAQN
ncbi:MAG TPA: glycosyltransferase, partial [Allocoleopsis sp.]